MSGNMLYNVMLVENRIVWQMNGVTMLLGCSEIKVGRLMNAEYFARNVKNAEKMKRKPMRNPRPFENVTWWMPLPEPPKEMQ